MQQHSGKEDWLVARILAGDAVALSLWVDARRSELLGDLHRRLGPGLRGRMEAEDLLQDTLLVATRALGTFRWTGAAGLRGWLLGIATNRIRQAARVARPKSRPRVTTPLAEELADAEAELALLAAGAPAPTDEAACREEAGSVASAVHGLPDEERLCVILREWLALPWETVAFVLERPGAESARQLHVRARRRLAERLERRG